MTNSQLIKDKFELINTSTIDDKNRVTLGSKIIDKISHALSKAKITSVNIYIDQDGDILLRPMASIPAREIWLYKNKKALSSVLEGLDDAREGRVKKLDVDSL